MTEAPDPFRREVAERYYLAFCLHYELDPEDQQSARQFEDYWRDTYGNETEN